ncbi:hypothetical protein SUGI_0970370 [Cryptomeria japonica]|uniref:uncharacterized protein LOC131033852 n=1 Tax=Cryptomeria japonica TaxID=3369 RepID=UPI002414A103|nr:uncharacterized protein LOC131033852 [Cryptomeria japonica]GLJ46061.1 hypothetical protein SUGI_0970370 [Cryptomeria japonica]
MDRDKILEFEKAYKSICKKLEILRSIYISNQNVSLVGSSENKAHPSRSCKPPTDTETIGVSHADTVSPAENSGGEQKNIGCSVNAKESIAHHSNDSAENVVVRVHHVQDETLEKESSPRLNKGIKSPQSMGFLKEQAQKWVEEQIIDVFEEHSGETGKQCTMSSFNNMSGIVEHLRQILQERVDQIEGKTKRVAELKELLSKEKHLVDSMRGVPDSLQGLLNQAFSTAENGIFMCSQCQFVAEKVKELDVHAKLDPGPSSCQFTAEDELEIRCNVNNLQNKKSSSVTSMHCLRDEDGKNDTSLIPLVQDTSNVACQLSSTVVNETHKTQHGNVMDIEDSKLSNLIERRVEPELDGSAMTCAVPPLKRKLIDDDCSNESGSQKAPRFIVHASKLQCANHSKGCSSTMSSENCYTRHSHHDIVSMSDLAPDHDNCEQRDHSMLKETSFKLALEEDLDDDVE